MKFVELLDVRAALGADGARLANVERREVRQLLDVRAALGAEGVVAANVERREVRELLDVRAALGADGVVAVNVNVERREARELLDQNPELSREIRARADTDLLLDMFPLLTKDPQGVYLLHALLYRNKILRDGRVSKVCGVMWAPSGWMGRRHVDRALGLSRRGG